jgi:N-acetylglucosaminyldiphosphoundecaprenol N-acetyl-beta-D-mannosaminyltransferase
VKADVTSTAPLSGRELVCVLGLPIDMIDLPTAVARVRHAALTRERCFISTPNLNFLINAQRDVSFRDSVLRSDLSLADGVSLLAVARLMGVHLPGRVSGADLFLELCASKEHPPLRVFFLGGPTGAAKLACERVNAQPQGVIGVGHHEGGFGDVESLSNQALIDAINETKPDFVVVSFGAQKGQAWIMRNHHRLTAPVISHLGAVVNFTAGTVKRAPRWMQTWGLEWLWRATTEPGLFDRYWKDGRALLSILIKEVILGAALERRTRRKHRQPAACQEMLPPAGGPRTLVLSGYWGRKECAQLRQALLSAPHGQAVRIDASQVSWFDPFALGTLAHAHGKLLGQGTQGLLISGLNARVKRQVERHELHYLLGS